ncbi:MAG: sensor histidine kinase [Candidatus Nitrosocosmicus sp.]
MKIRSKLIVILIPLVFLSIFLISYIGVVNFTRSIQSEIINELKLVAINLMDKLSRQMFERTADITFLSNNNILSNPNITLSEKMNYLRSMERAVKAYSSISIYNKSGFKIGDTRNVLIGDNDYQQKFFQEAIKGKTYYSPIPTLTKSLNQYVIQFSAPIYGKNKEFQGVVVANYPINKINDIFNKIISPRNQIDVNSNLIKLDLISNNGTIIYSNYDRKSILHTKPEIQQLVSKHMIQSDLNLINNNVDNSILNGTELFVSASQGDGYLDYKGSGWILILRENTGAVFSDVQNIVNQSIFASTIIIIISIIIILLIARNISTPISKLMKKVIELGKGDYYSKIEINSSDEIGELARQFDLMRQELNKVNSNLNKLVEERTSELKNANEVLKSKEDNLRKLNKELINADLAKEEFMSMVSHELKTPLVPARGYLEIMLRQKKTGILNDKQKKFVDVIYRNILKLEYLVNDVLEVYKLDIGKLRFSKKLENINDLMKSIETESRILIMDKKIDLTFKVLTDKNDYILCDIKRIEQVFSNLIKNSMDFVPLDLGKIIITVDRHEDGKSIKFSVYDNGPGIPAEEADNLFQKFYQIDTSETRKHSGTGLGLVICKGIIEAHGGKIWIDKEYTTGASFVFTIPLANGNEKGGLDITL